MFCKAQQAGSWLAVPHRRGRRPPSSMSGVGKGKGKKATASSRGKEPAEVRNPAVVQKGKGSRGGEPRARRTQGSSAARSSDHTPPPTPPTPPQPTLVQAGVVEEEFEEDFEEEFDEDEDEEGSEDDDVITNPLDEVDSDDGEGGQFNFDEVAPTESQQIGFCVTCLSSWRAGPVSIFPVSISAAAPSQRSNLSNPPSRMPVRRFLACGDAVQMQRGEEPLLGLPPGVLRARATGMRGAAGGRARGRRASWRWRGA